MSTDNQRDESPEDRFSSRLREPLNETTRKARRNLLAASLIGVVIADVGLVPTKFSALGVDFTASNQQALITLLIFVIGYFGVSFITYFYSEMAAYGLMPVISYENGERGNLYRRSINNVCQLVLNRQDRAYALRLFVEVVIPLVFATYACVGLLQANPIGEGETKDSRQSTTEWADFQKMQSFTGTSV